MILVHLDAAYNLARWLTRSDHDAQDVVQDACIRAFRAFDQFRGGDPRAWLLTIVRNVSLTWNKNRKGTKELDDELYEPSDDQPDPQAILLRAADAQRVREAIEQLPSDLRSVIVLREMEGLSYKQIAGAAEVPIGTVMSRLARARQRLAVLLTEPDAVKEL
jgi:RNA polymerase sigma-70 factor (ECF subfamily)